MTVSYFSIATFPLILVLFSLIPFKIEFMVKYLFQCVHSGGGGGIIYISFAVTLYTNLSGVLVGVYAAGYR